MADYHRILPCAASQKSPSKEDKGWRLRLSREDGESAHLVEEQVLPERVMRPDANRILASLGEMWLTTDEVRWLRDVLAELHPIMEKQDADDQARIDARRTARAKENEHG